MLFGFLSSGNGVLWETQVFWRFLILGKTKWAKTEEPWEWFSELVSCVNDGGNAEFSRTLSAWLFQKADEAARLYWLKAWFFLFCCVLSLAFCGAGCQITLRFCENYESGLRAEQR